MKQITSGSSAIKLSRHERRKMIEQIRRMGYITKVVKVAIDQQSELFSFTLRSVNESLTQAQEIIWDRANGNLTSDEMETFQQITMNYLATMLQISDMANISILKNMVHLDIDDPKGSFLKKLNFPLLED